MPDARRVRSAPAGSTIAACHLAILALLVAPGPGPAECSEGARVRRSDDYDNMDNSLTSSNDYDAFFRKIAKSVPRIGRRDGGGESAASTPIRVGRRSVDMNELVPSTGGGYSHFFVKASKSVPRIGKRNDEFFAKTAKSVPRIGRRSGDGPDNFLQKGRYPSDFLKTVERGDRPLHRVDRRSRLEVEEQEPVVRDAPGGGDALLDSRHRLQRRSYYLASRLAKRMHPALNEVGDFGTESQWPWFRQPDTSSQGPYKRANSADSINFQELPWDSIDELLRTLEKQRRGSEYTPELDAEDKHPDIILLREADDSGDKWHYGINNHNNNSANKEVEELRFQPDVK